ncbi:hypothetical protein P153DRAFT_30521 [Dothidotthia symphoricarpi CBS 119687]|uniref:Uncharacterized protein n=1 Tax=Dothidotthia symphoricarpi CBS 119687 TaxID=1392245 RepID=A0A6A6AD35_9PLEO|nr:uncharacterized protein P153DRAFT_30521 [Dothidotthia symphoricarpi CBS 119687]KAF2129035.1 hypothetical protein P153DRAFT_30521 [Dothidotthia symphoricarpi CBS 119687]
MSSRTSTFPPMLLSSIDTQCVAQSTHQIHDQNPKHGTHTRARAKDHTVNIYRSKSTREKDTIAAIHPASQHIRIQTSLKRGPKSFSLTPSYLPWTPSPHPIANPDLRGVDQRTITPNPASGSQPWLAGWPQSRRLYYACEASEACDAGGDVTRAESCGWHTRGLGLGLQDDGGEGRDVGLEI